MVALVAPAPADRFFWVGGTGGTKYLVLPGECSGDTEFHPSAGLDQNYPRNKNRIGQSPHWKTGLIPVNTGSLQPVFVDNWERVVASRAHSTSICFFLLQHRGGAWVDPIHICLLLGETRWQSGVNDSIALTPAKTQPNPTTIYELSNYMLLHPLYIYINKYIYIYITYIYILYMNYICISVIYHILSCRPARSPPVATSAGRWHDCRGAKNAAQVRIEPGQEVCSFHLGSVNKSRIY